MPRIHRYRDVTWPMEMNLRCKPTKVVNGHYAVDFPRRARKGAGFTERRRAGISPEVTGEPIEVSISSKTSCRKLWNLCAIAYEQGRMYVSLELIYSNMNRRHNCAKRQKGFIILRTGHNLNVSLRSP